MSTRSYDHCTCGHNREKHSDFQNECASCKCIQFSRNIRIETPAA